MKIRFDFKPSRPEDFVPKTIRIGDGCLSPEELEEEISALDQSSNSPALKKARAFALIGSKSALFVDPNQIFQSRVEGEKLLARQRKRWEAQVIAEYLDEETRDMEQAWKTLGAYKGSADYGHTSPNTPLLLSLGFPALRDRMVRFLEDPLLSPEQRDYYLAAKIVLDAVITVAERFAKAILPYSKENSDAMRQLTVGPPRTSYEAMQLLLLYFSLHEFVGGTRVRTLGRLDVLLTPFYQSDLKNGIYTEEELFEMLRFFLFAFRCANVPFDLPFCLGGGDAEGGDVTNEVSFRIVEAYDSLNIHSPKIHIRVSPNTPREFLRLVLSVIRKGNSGFVFIQDKIAVQSLMKIGVEERDAWNFVPIGCYEPAVWGVELGCTGNGGINLAKALEAVFNQGKDLQTSLPCGATPPDSFFSMEDFVRAVKEQIAFMTEQACQYVVKIEGHYGKINPDPLLSCQYEESVRRGLDLYEGGAKYNNSSLSFYCLATLVDSLCAVKALVFDQKLLSVEQLGAILRANWQGHEKLRLRAAGLTEKYGNGTPLADAYTAELSDFCAKLLNGRPNGRGGVFRAALFTIDHYSFLGARTMATPDGRRAGEPLSKNLSSSLGMDRRGVTALIRSATVIDHSDFPNGLVLDLVLHPTAVTGEDGLEAFLGLLTTYFKRGGLALQGNVFDSSVLKDAQKHPERYQNLQVRLCGWNVFFVNLNPEEQNAFIRQTEAL